MVKWHCQHQRIQGEQADMALVKSQMSQLSTLASVMGGASPEAEPETDMEFFE